MSFKMIALVMSTEFKGKGAGVTRAIAIQLASYADERGKGIWPSMGRLAKDTGFDEKTCRRTVHKLIAEIGFLRVTEEANTNPKHKTPTYEIREDWIKAHDKSVTEEPKPTPPKAYSPWTIPKPQQQTPKPEPPANRFTPVHEGVQKALERAFLLRQKAKTEDPLQ